MKCTQGDIPRTLDKKLLRFFQSPPCHSLAMCLSTSLSKPVSLAAHPGMCTKSAPISPYGDWLPCLEPSRQAWGVIGAGATRWHHHAGHLELPCCSDRNHHSWEPPKIQGLSAEPQLTWLPPLSPPYLPQSLPFTFAHCAPQCGFTQCWIFLLNSLNR